MSADNIILAFQALRLQPGVQCIEAVEPGSRNQEVPPAKADHTLDIALVIPFARPPKLVLEQIMGLQL